LVQILERGIPTFLDEAYYEFQDQVVTHANLIASYPHLMINRTFSKAMGLAGFRLGYLLCDARMADYINRVKIPWNVNHLTIAAAITLLNDEQGMYYKRQNVINGREYIRTELNRLEGIWAYPSQGNFVLIDAGCLQLSANEIRDRLMKKGVFIRPMSGVEIGNGFVRVTVGLPEQNEKFIQAFCELYREINPQE
jgi:histidinol-phosphate aminotransferase